MPTTPATMSVNDGSTTPVAITYSLEEKQNGNVLFVDRRLSSRELQPEFVLGMKRPAGKARTYNVVRNGKIPIVRSINGVDTVVGYNKVLITFVVDKASTEQERKHLYAMGTNFNAQASAKTQVEALEAWN